MPPLGERWGAHTKGCSKFTGRDILCLRLPERLAEAMKEMFVAASAPVTKLDFGQKWGIGLKREGQSSVWRWKR